MRSFIYLTKRNMKLFFKDKGMFLVSLITPIILLVLYATFLANVYRNSFTSAIPDMMTLPEKLINGFVAGQLLSSLLAVTPITVAFNSNMRMVQDKICGVNKDLLMTPTKKHITALSYLAGSLIATLAVSYIALAAGLIYASFCGWYLTFGDIAMLVIAVFMLSLFGTLLSSSINIFLTSQGQISAVGAIISSGYGFLCGAYMPISQFGIGLQRVLMFLPGTYGTSIMRNHAMGGVFREMASLGLPEEVIKGIKSSVDCEISFFDTAVSLGGMYLVLSASLALLATVYILLSVMRKKSK